MQLYLVHAAGKMRKGEMRRLMTRSMSADGTPPALDIFLVQCLDEKDLVRRLTIRATKPSDAQSSRDCRWRFVVCRDLSCVDGSHSKQQQPTARKTSHIQLTTPVSLLTSHKGNPGPIPGRVTPDFRMWESCRMMPLVGGFLEPMRVIEVNMEQRRNEREGETVDPEKTRLPTAPSNTIPTCENPE
ncbi:hypothetical protein PR048_021838 [Dryococelus australis]|uniref:Uncharacterized protein n=1 Tax=Dryococelus australis TaxID=614101 RepID=A0ABQ9GZA8_9NEOP|nr:hypothetical protein PR048_021838 [Dryococelus australis]